MNSIFSTYTSALFEKVSVNVVKMLMCHEKRYIVVACEDLSEWIEARVLKQATFMAVVRFLWKNIITRHDVFNKLICDGGPENKMWVKDLVNLYGIQWMIVSEYNLGANGMMKQGHKSLIDGLSKMMNGDLSK